MEKYIAGQALSITVSLTDDAGVHVVASAASYRLLTETGAVLVGATAVPAFIAGDELVVIVVSGANNTLSGVTRGLRSLELTLTTTVGPRLLEYTYLIHALEPLTVPDDSFQTLKEAILLATTMPQVGGWDGATSDDRASALIEARLHIASISYYFTFTDQSHLEPEFGVSDLKLLTESEYDALSDEFRTALCRAQVYEADEILTGTNSYEGKRRAGVFSETIGESSVMLRPGRIADRLISDRAARVLGRYMRNTIRIARA